jgi:hypothetical protein
MPRFATIKIRAEEADDAAHPEMCRYNKFLWLKLESIGL